MDRSGIDVQLLGLGQTDAPAFDCDDMPARLLFQGDEQHLAGTVLVHRDRLGGAGVGVRHITGPAFDGRVPVAEGQVVEPGPGDLLLRDDDRVRVRATGDRQRPMDHADLPRSTCVRRGVQPGQRAPRRSLRVEDAAVDDGIERREDHLR